MQYVNYFYKVKEAVKEYEKWTCSKEINPSGPDARANNI